MESKEPYQSCLEIRNFRGTLKARSSTMGNSRLLVTKGFGHNLKSVEVVKEVVQFIESTTAYSTSRNPTSSFHNL